jgi:hypothetical protein
LACLLQIDADLDPVLDPAYHFDADPDVQVTKNYADPDPQHFFLLPSFQFVTIPVRLFDLDLNLHTAMFGESRSSFRIVLFF